MSFYSIFIELNLESYSLATAIGSKVVVLTLVFKLQSCHNIKRFANYAVLHEFLRMIMSLENWIIIYIYTQCTLSSLDALTVIYIYIVEICCNFLTILEAACSLALVSTSTIVSWKSDARIAIC